MVTDRNTAEPGGEGAGEPIFGIPAVTANSALQFIGYSPTVWVAANFAPRWYEDALREAGQSGPDYRRREILFSVAAAESYLFEWVRDVVLHHDFSRLNEYFPPGHARPIRDKWKEIPRALAATGLIVGAPDLGRGTWQDFTTLVDFRNGLLHAVASRPETSGLTEDILPKPSMTDLSNQNRGWAVRVVFNLVCELNAAAGTTIPNWLVCE